MNAPRATSRKPKDMRNRVFTVLVHKDHYKPNPARSAGRRGAGGGKTRGAVPKQQYTDEELREAEIADLETDIRCAERDNLPEYATQCRQRLAALKKTSAGKGPVVLGGPKPGYLEGFQLTPYVPSVFATEGEIRRRMGLIDDHLLAEYPQIMDQLPTWLAQHADVGAADIEGEIHESDLEDYLEQIDLPVVEVIEELIAAKILFHGETHSRLFYPEVDAPPPLTNALEGTAWALAQVGYEPSLAQDIVDLLEGFVRDEDDAIDRSDLSTALEDWTKHRSNFVIDDPGDKIVDELIRANVLIEGAIGGDVLYDANTAGRADPYVLTFLRKVRDEYKKKGHTRYAKIMADRIIEIESRLNRLSVEPTKYRKKAQNYIRVPGTYRSYPARPVEELIPGDEVRGLTDNVAAIVLSVAPATGDFYSLSLSAPRIGEKPVVKRLKKGKLIAIEADAPPPPDPEPPTHLDVPPLHISDPNLLTILAQFEGKAWMLKQQRYPLCPKCVNANQQAWKVLQKLGPKGKGLRIEHLMENGGSIEGSDRYGHWYAIDENGNVLIESDTATDAARKAMLEMGIQAT